MILLLCVSGPLFSILLFETAVRPQSKHLNLLNLSRSLSLASDKINLRLNTSASRLPRSICSRKVSSTNLVISYMVVLRTVSMTADSWVWNERTSVSVIPVSDLRIEFSQTAVQQR